VLHSHGSISFDLKDEVADGPEKPGALEANVLNQAAGSLAPVTIASSILAAKVQESSATLFTIVTKMASRSCDAARLQAQARESGAGGDLWRFAIVMNARATMMNGSVAEI
jgi:hypothetical protein